MTDKSQNSEDYVSRRRYMRERQARAEAEQLLEQKSRELYLANQELSAHSAKLEEAVRERTKDLELALAQAEQAGQAKSRFVATMSHEIRTPLGGMLGMIDLLAMDETDPGKLELLNYAVTAGTGLSRIVNDVLDFSKMEAGVFIFEEERVDVRALIESVKMLAASNEKSADRTIAVKVEKDVPKTFLGDGTRIRQVISNFVNNALRYSLEGPIIIRVTSSPHKKGAVLRVEVEDFGIGIDHDGLSDLFKDFSQIANPLTAAAQGTGLGLAICKRILEGCGGTIGVESAPGVGSTFWFELPVTVLEQTTGSELPLASDAADLASNVLEGKRALIAEDNIINQKLLTTYAKRMGLLPEIAENGRIALEMFDPAKYDLVLMDVAMPEMDGLEATRRIRLKWADASMPPIIALTAHVMDAIGEEAAIVGIDTILSKPIPFEELKHALQTALTETGAVEAEPAQAAPQVEEIQNVGSVLDKMAPATVAEMLDVFSEEMLLDLVRKFIADSTERLERVKQASMEGDTATVSDEGHSIKGAAMVLGFLDLSEQARQIEKVPTDEHSVRRAVEQIEAQFADLLKGL